MLNTTFIPTAAVLCPLHGEVLGMERGEEVPVTESY